MWFFLRGFFQQIFLGILKSRKPQNPCFSESSILATNIATDLQMNRLIYTDCRNYMKDTIIGLNILYRKIIGMYFTHTHILT